MKSRVVYSMNGILTQATSMASGIAEHGTDLLLKYSTEVGINTARTAAVNSNTAVESAEEALRNLYGTMESATREARTFGTLARENLKGTFGRAYSTDWNSVGFYGSLRIPTKTEGLELLMEKFNAFYGTNASKEITSQQLTAVRAKEIGDLIRDTRTGIESKKTELKNLLIDRQTKVTALRGKLMELVGELELAMDKMDARWLSFGLRIPGAPRTPEVPTGVIAVLIGPTAVSVKWNRAARAKYYRVFKRVVGVDTEFVPVGNAGDLDLTIEGLEPNAVIEIVVAAGNAAGVSGFSEPFSFTTQ